MELTVTDAAGAVVARAQGQDELYLVHDRSHEEGTVLNLNAPDGSFLVVALDDAMAPALIFLRDGHFAFPIPFGPAAEGYSPCAFTGTRRRSIVRLARHEEIAARRDLALNPYDHAQSTAFPHASANAATRGEACFAARTAIDGEIANDGHGHWPYTSWGIAQNPRAALTVTFGRPVIIDEIALTLRADFPHDSWWRSATINFGNGDTESLALAKTGRRQAFPIKQRQVVQLVLQDLVAADDPSPFPALTRIEAMGVEYAPSSKISEFLDGLDERMGIEN
ncbi:carbohydrate-binding protein [Pelagibacterium halotolerans]